MRAMDGLRPKGHAGTADHTGGCPGQNILEVKNSAADPTKWEKAKEDEEGSHCVRAGCIIIGLHIHDIWRILCNM